MIARFIICLLLAAAPVRAADYALLIGGLSGQEPYRRWYNDWLARFQTQLGVPAANSVTLAENAATTGAITNALANFAKQVQPSDRFILVIVGHGEIHDTMPTLTLPGPDLTAAQLATALNAILAKTQVVLNFSASSGDFLKHLAAPDRVNVTATSPTENEEPVFPEFFLRGLESKRAADPTGAVTVLSAYNWAAQQTALWIARWESSGTNIWKASGQETVAIFEKLYAGVPMRLLDPASDRTAADAVVALQPPNGEVTAEWRARRVVDEHALLEDCGQPVGVSVIGDKGFQPITGQKPPEPGHLARRITLGRANP